MVSLTSSFYNVSNITAPSQDDFNATFLNVTLKEKTEDADDRVIFDYVILPLTVVIIILVLIALIVFLIRKKRLDKLRHHLMPLYSFDPAEEGEDWEAELLEEGTDHQPRGKNAKPSEPPQLSFRSNL